MDNSDRKRIFLSNGITSALELNGSIIWFPVPHFDSPSVFSKILDEKKGGYFSIRPIERYSLKSEYLGNSLIARDTFATRNGNLTLLDFLSEESGALIRIFDSKVPFQMEITPAFGYAKRQAIPKRGKKGIVFTDPESRKHLDLFISTGYKTSDYKTYLLPPGKGYVIANCSAKPNLNPYKELEAAKQHWKKLYSKCRKINDFKETYYRSIAVMAGLTYAPSGGIIAASTTSLPAIVGEEYNWDYRYVWVRDLSYAIEALVKCGLLDNARQGLSFLLGRVSRSSKSFAHPLYTIEGRTPPPERPLGWLAGYKESKPVRVGNAASEQMQRDCEGDFMAALYTYYVHSKDLSYVRKSMWAIDAISDWCSRTWQEKSLSLWEERSEERHYVHTKVMNWVALDRASRLKTAVGDEKDAEELRKVADGIKNEVLEKGFSKRLNSFVKCYGGEEVDSSLLTLALYEFIDARDKRFLGTLKLILNRLMKKDGLLLRTENDYEKGNSSPFALINTWLARVYIKTGDRASAKKSIANLIKYSTDLNLFSERINSRTKGPVGNFPQLFPHAGLLEAIVDYEDLVGKD